MIMTQSNLFQVLVAIVALAPAWLNAQTAPRPLPGAQAADSLFRTQQWDAAVKAYRTMTSLDSTRPMPWVRLATAEYNLKRFPEAARDFARAGTITTNPLHFYNAGASHALARDANSAFRAFDQALSAGFSDTTQLHTDSDLASIRDDARFAPFLDRVRKQARPCAYAPEWRQFDFWVGEWEVRNPQGAVAGTSSVTLILADCVLLEQFSPRVGTPGQSFSTYNKDRKAWQQLYLDARGGVQDFTGRATAIGMVFEIVGGPVAGANERFRMSLSKGENQTVRQLGERSINGGKSWTTEYDLLYLRKPKK